MVVVVAKYNKLDVELVNAFPIKVYPEKGGVGEEYLSKFHTGKVPAFETSDGFCVSYVSGMKENLGFEGAQLTVVTTMYAIGYLM
jgi:hypothetical protein